MSPDLSTCATLLDRLRCSPTDQEAWRQFVDRYAPRIHTWCSHWGLQPADAEDVTQTVLTILASRMKTFVYDPGLRFRGWLQVVTRHAWSAFVEGRQRAPRGSRSGLVEATSRRDEHTFPEALWLLPRSLRRTHTTTT